MSAPFKVVGNRGFGRRRSLLHAVVQMERRPPVRCLVRRMDESGALIEFAQPIVLQQRFRLFWEDLGVSADCEVHRAEATTVKIRFTSPDGPMIARRFGGDHSHAHETAAAIVPAPTPASATPNNESTGADLVQRLRGMRSAG